MVINVHKALLNVCFCCLNLRLHDASVPTMWATTWAWTCTTHLSCPALSHCSPGWPSLLSQVWLHRPTLLITQLICGAVCTLTVGLWFCLHRTVHLWRWRKLPKTISRTWGENRGRCGDPRGRAPTDPVCRHTKNHSWCGKNLQSKRRLNRLRFQKSRMPHVSIEMQRSWPKNRNPGRITVA